jgi:hypothetical protein
MLPEIYSIQHYVLAQQRQIERDAARWVKIHGDQLPVRGPSLLSHVGRAYRRALQLGAALLAG